MIMSFKIRPQKLISILMRNFDKPKKNERIQNGLILLMEASLKIFQYQKQNGKILMKQLDKGLLNKRK